MAGFIALDTTGLKESLNALDKTARLDASKDLRVQFNKLAVEAVKAGRGHARTRMQRRAAATLQSTSSVTSAGLRFGAGFAGAFGSEYGGNRNQRRVVPRVGYYTGWNQFQGWKGSGSDAGYFMWPGIRDAVKENLEPLGDAIADIFEKAG